MRASPSGQSVWRTAGAIRAAQGPVCLPALVVGAGIARKDRWYVPVVWRWGAGAGTPRAPGGCRRCCSPGGTAARRRSGSTSWSRTDRITAPHVMNQSVSGRRTTRPASRSSSARHVAVVSSCPNKAANEAQVDTGGLNSSAPTMMATLTTRKAAGEEEPRFRHQPPTCPMPTFQSRRPFAYRLPLPPLEQAADLPTRGRLYK